MYRSLSIGAKSLCDAATNHYNSIESSIKGNYTQEYVYRVDATKDILYSLGNSLVAYFGDTYGMLAAKSWEQGIYQHREYVKHVVDQDFNIELIKEYGEKARKYDKNFQTPSVSRLGCYVATAIYGSYDCPEVWTLRRFRDNTLDTTWYGKSFIKVYYAVSPTLVKWFGNTSWFKNLLHKPLNHFVYKLNRKGVKNTPYNDK